MDKATEDKRNHRASDGKSSRGKSSGGKSSGGSHLVVSQRVRAQTKVIATIAKSWSPETLCSWPQKEIQHHSSPTSKPTAQQPGCRGPAARPPSKGTDCSPA
jgi:hypothetical protein